MSELSDVNYHLEEGLLHFMRGSLLDARQIWRRALQLDERNAIALDYLRSSEMELTGQERTREAELLRSAKEKNPGASVPWEDDDFEVIADGGGEDEDTLSGANDTTLSVTGFMVDEDAHAEVEMGPETPPMTHADAHTWAGASDPDADVFQGSGPVRSTVAPHPPPTADAFTEGSVHRSGEHELWEPLDWVGEVTPAAPSHRADRRPAGGPARAVPPPPVRRAGVTPPPPVDEMPQSLLSLAEQQLRQGDPELSRQTLLRLLERHPGFPGALEGLERAVTELLSQYSSILGDNAGVPRLNRPQSEVFKLNLDEVGGYLLSCIDGMMSLDDIYTVSAHVDRLHVMRILVELVREGVIVIEHGSH